MNREYDRLSAAVMAWTIFTTVFLWTSTMRGFFMPELPWAVGSLRGAGRDGMFWIFPALAAAAVFLFYLEGRNRLRPLFHLLLLAWHLSVTGLVVYGAIQGGSKALFQGAMWGVRIPLWVAALPLVLFSILAVVWVARETRGATRLGHAPWAHIHWKKLGIAALLLPLAVLFFHLGEGFGWHTKLATAVIILQWILLAESVGHSEMS
jgi:hypothetical protein